LDHEGSSGRYRRASPANTLYRNQGIRKTSHSWIHLVGSERWDGQRRKTHRRKRSRSRRRRTCYIPICKIPDHMLMDKKCDQSGMRNYVEGQVNRNPKTAPSILFAMMDQYVDEDTDIEENVIVNNLDEEHADEDSSDIEEQVNWNIATERDPEFSRHFDVEDF
jgi:hypothetical protein